MSEQLSDGYLTDNWYTIGDVLKRGLLPGVYTRQGVTRLCRAGKLRAKKLGRQGQAEWRLDPKQFETAPK